MDQEELFRRLGVSLAIGLLVGLERGWQTREESDHQRTAGLRTFALTGLLGGICGLISLVSSPFVLAAGLLAFTGALVTFSFLEAAAEKNFSVTRRPPARRRDDSFVSSSVGRATVAVTRPDGRKYPESGTPRGRPREHRVRLGIASQCQSRTEPEPIFERCCGRRATSSGRSGERLGQHSSDLERTWDCRRRRVMPRYLHRWPGHLRGADGRRGGLFVTQTNQDTERTL